SRPLAADKWAPSRDSVLFGSGRPEHESSLSGNEPRVRCSRILPRTPRQGGRIGRPSVPRRNMAPETNVGGTSQKAKGPPKKAIDVLERFLLRPAVIYATPPILLALLLV